MKKKQPRFETSSGSKKIDTLVERHNGQIKTGRTTIHENKIRPLSDQSIGKRFLDFAQSDAKEVSRNGSSESVSTISVNDKFQRFKLGSKFQRKGDSSTFQLRRRTQPVAPGSTTYKGELYLYSKATNEFIFHYAVSTEFTFID